MTSLYIWCVTGRRGMKGWRQEKKHIAVCMLEGCWCSALEEKIQEVREINQQKTMQPGEAWPVDLEVMG